MLTRRELVRGNPALAHPDDPGHLTRLIAFETLAIQVYGLAEESTHIGVRGKRLVSELRRQELAHAVALQEALERLAPGGAPAASLPGQTASIGAALTAGVEQTLTAVEIPADFAKLTDERAWFHLLEELENRLQGAYNGALRDLVDPSAATLAARILASEAQHSTALSRLRHPGNVAQAVPTGLVVGILRARS